MKVKVYLMLLRTAPYGVAHIAATNAIEAARLFVDHPEVGAYDKPDLKEYWMMGGTLDGITVTGEPRVLSLEYCRPLDQG